MALAARQTIANEVFDRINEALREVKTYWPTDSWEFRQLHREAVKLTNADSFQGALAQALVFQLAGDHESAARWARNADAHPGHTLRVTLAKALTLSNLGFFTQARELLLSLKPKEWPIDRCSLFLAAGCLSSLELRAQGDLTDADEVWNEDLAIARRCNMSLANAKLDEQYMALVADLAGEVFQAHKMFFAGAKPIIRTFDDGVLYQFAVHVDAKTSADMTEEVIIKMVERNLDHEGLSFSFIPA